MPRSVDWLRICLTHEDDAMGALLNIFLDEIRRDWIGRGAW
jgi:hypothetical protein